MDTKNDDIEKQLGITDKDYDVPIQNQGYAHMIALAAAIMLPIVMVVSLLIQSGIKGLFNIRFLLIVPIIAILYFIVRYTNNLASISVSDIEKRYDNIIIIEPQRINNGEPSRPKTIGIHVSDGSTAPFAFLTRYDYEKHNTTFQHNGIIVLKGNKAAIMIEDTSNE
jgi:hypothetical protein